MTWREPDYGAENNMADLSTFLPSLTVGASVQNATGDLGAAAAAGGYAAWVQSVTGAAPSVRALPDGRAQLSLTPAQNQAMQGFLDRQVASIFQPSAEKPTVDYQLGKFMTPWAMKYMIPAGVGLFVLGWVAAYYFQGR